MENKELEIINQIKDIIRKVRPYLQQDGGDVEFVEFVNGIVYVRLMGACVGCTSIDSTLRDGIEAILVENVEGVIGVEQVDYA